MAKIHFSNRKTLFSKKWIRKQQSKLRQASKSYHELFEPLTVFDQVTIMRKAEKLAKNSKKHDCLIPKDVWVIMERFRYIVLLSEQFNKTIQV